MSRRFVILTLAALGVSAGLFQAGMTHAQTTSQGSASLESAVKATYLYKFAPFVTWPPRGDSAINICVVGADPFGSQLDRAIAGQSIDGRPFRVVRIDVIAADSSCDIAYIGGSRTQPVDSALHAVHGSPVLTVTDDAATPGMIDFAMQDGHVRFRIDLQAAEDGGLGISSKLLDLAVTVRTRRVLQ